MKFKKPFLLISTLVIGAMVFHGCNKNSEEETGTIEFGMETLNDEALKAVENGHHNVAAALVTIKNSEGEKVYDKEYLPFYSFGDAFVTQSLQLKVGKFQLTEFMLLDSSENVIWATPVEGSRLAGMVNDPVPIEFVVYADNTTRVVPEVVRVADHPPADFGYVNFSVEFVENFCIRVFFESRCSDWYNDSILMLADSAFSAPFYLSRMIIYADGEMVAETTLEPGKNRVMIPRGHDMYKLVVLDCGNQVCFSDMFGQEELRMFNCSEGEFLHIGCGPVPPEVIVTPDDVVEPTIEQGVFGRITEPLYDSTDTDEYNIQPMVTELYIYRQHEGDTIFYPAMGADCYVMPDLYMEPLAVVRSNVHGYYQLPLEKGNYTYMVQTPFGFYVDMYVSSHLPGRFEVQTGDVTRLNIHVQPCIWF